MARLKTFYHADGRRERVSAETWDRKTRAQAAAAARHGKVIVRNSRGRPRLLEPEAAVQYQARQAAARRAPRDAQGRLVKGLPTFAREIQRTIEQGRAGVVDLQRPLAPGGTIYGPEAEIRERGDFGRWVGQVLEEGRQLGATPLWQLRITISADGQAETRVFGFDPRPSVAPEDLRWPEAVYTWAGEFLSRFPAGAAAFESRGAQYGTAPDQRPSTRILEPGDLPGGLGPVLAAGTGIQDTAPAVPYVLQAEFVS